jgi:hypothetical protein
MRGAGRDTDRLPAAERDADRECFRCADGLGDADRRGDGRVGGHADGDGDRHGRRSDHDADPGSEPGALSGRQPGHGHDRRVDHAHRVASRRCRDAPPRLPTLPAAGGAATVRARVTDLTGSELFDKGSPNNQDSNADLISDRVRFSLVSTSGVLGTILTVRFDRCDGALATVAGDFACTLQNVVATDGVTPIVGASCGVGVTHLP